MARQRKQAAPQSDATTNDQALTDTPVTEETVTDGTDFDPAKLEAQQPAGDPTDDAPPTATHASRVSQGGERPRTKIPDPFGIISIALTDQNDGPKARMLRNSREQTMEIQFDENPGREITDQIKAEGWRWESRARHIDAAGKEHRGAWVKPLDHDEAWRTHADAEKLLKSVANQIREKNGLEPATVMGVMDR